MNRLTRRNLRRFNGVSIAGFSKGFSHDTDTTKAQALKSTGNTARPMAVAPYCRMELGYPKD
jgi:hypothetical protein